LESTPTAPGIITIRNDTGTNLSRFYVAAITGVVITPSANQAEFKNNPAFVASWPTADTLDKCVILMELIATGAFGRAMILGVTPVLISVTNENHGYAQPSTMTPAYLVSATSGSFRILWKESGTGVKWAVVQFPVGGGSGGGIRRAQVTFVGNFAITVKNLDDSGSMVGDEIGVWILPSRANAQAASRFPLLSVGTKVLYATDPYGSNYLVAVEPVLLAINCDV
jgi:hypothetical protein